MIISDLLFLAALLASVVTLSGIVIATMRGHRAATARAFLIYAACLAAYFMISVAAAYVRPQRIRAAHEPWCFDDWCLEVTDVSSVPSTANVRYTVKLRIFSTARRVSQRANGAWIYLIDERHKLYAPIADPSAIPLTVELAPLESVDTTRVFDVQTDARTLGLITGHPTAYCALTDVLFIGQAKCLFGKPDVIAIK